MSGFTIINKRGKTDDDLPWRVKAPEVTRRESVIEAPGGGGVVQNDTHIGPHKDFDARKEFRINPLDMQTPQGAEKITRKIIAWHLSLGKDAARAFKAVKEGQAALHECSDGDKDNFEIIYRDGVRTGIKVSPAMATQLGIILPAKVEISQW